MADLSDFVGEYIFTLIPDCSEVHQTDATVVSFGLDNMVIFVHENPSDGYRSHVGDVVVAGLADCSKVHNRILPVNQYVICEFSDSCDEDILRIRSAKTGLLIFIIGTDSADDYYPCFVWTYYPENLDANQEMNENA
jgi:hypothetical protein